jgi:hypothetical protein
MVLIGLRAASRILRYYVSLLSYISINDIHLVINLYLYTLLISPYSNLSLASLIPPTLAALV